MKGGAISVGAGAAVAPLAAPVNVGAPAITGTPNTGQTLTVSNGSWTANPTPTYTYQWKRAGTNISAATSSTYVLVSGDVGNAITCVVTATNSQGSANATSNSVTPTSGASPYATAVLADSPLLYWRLGEASGTTAADASGNGNTGTYTNVTLGATGLISGTDTAAGFAGGADERVESAVSIFAATTAYTFEGWAKRTDSLATYSLFGGASGSYGPRVRVNTSGDITFETQYGFTPFTWAAAWPGNGVAVHWAITVAAGATSAQLFINGVSVGTSAPGSVPDWGQTAHLVAGSYNTIGAGAESWKGVLDEYAVYTGILSSARIAAHYAAR